MTDGEALRQAVVANRQDDTPRLIYADWLDENGQPDRAAFIRAQVEAAQALPFGTAARSAEERAGRLLEQHRKAWTSHLPGSFREPRFQRGFIEHLAIEPVSVGPIQEMLEQEPLQSLRFFRSDDVNLWVSLLPVLQLPQLGHLHHLELTSRNGFDHDEYTALLQLPHLQSIHRLSLRGSAIRPSWLVEMFLGKSFPELAALDIADNTNLGPSLLQALSQAAHRELKSLDISRVGIKSEQLQQALACRCLKHVEELRLGYRRFFPTELGPLFHLDIGWVLPWKRLVVLDLDGQRLGEKGVEEIVAQENASSLRWLNLANNDLGPEAVRLLVHSKHLNLCYLNLSGNRFPVNARVKAELQDRFPDALIVY